MLAPPPSTLKPAPLEATRLPAVAVQPVPPMDVSFTPLTPPVEPRLAKVRLRWPGVRFRGVTPETLTLPPTVGAPKFGVFGRRGAGRGPVTPPGCRPGFVP